MTQDTHQMTNKEANLAFAKRLSDAQTIEEVAAIAKEEGYDLTEEQLNEIYTHVSEHRVAGESGELSNEELEDVTGGLLFTASVILGILYGTNKKFRSTINNFVKDQAKSQWEGKQYESQAWQDAKNPRYQRPLDK